jgi:hypothetical protein
MFPIVVEDEVVSNKSFDDCCTGRISMIINLILSGLGIFTQARPDVGAKSHASKRRSVTESLHLLAAAIQRNLAKLLLSSGARLPCNILFP